MKKLSCILILLLIIGLLPACSAKTENIVFEAEITSINDSSIEVTTSDEVGFDKAVVSYAENMEPIRFNLIVGQKVRITALPEISETYPVQLTAVSVELSD